MNSAKQRERVETTNGLDLICFDQPDAGTLLRTKPPPCIGVFKRQLTRVFSETGRGAVSPVDVLAIKGKAGPARRASRQPCGRALDAREVPGGGKNLGREIGLARHQLLVGRVPFDLHTLLGNVGVTVLADPVGARAKFGVSKHVKQRHLDDRRVEELGTLGDCRANEEATLAAANIPSRRGLVILRRIRPSATAMKSSHVVRSFPRGRLDAIGGSNSPPRAGSQRHRHCPVRARAAAPEDRRACPVYVSVVPLVPQRPTAHLHRRPLSNRHQQDRSHYRRSAPRHDFDTGAFEHCWLSRG